MTASAPFGVLSQFVRTGASARRAPSESCEMCGQELGSAHQHLLELATRRLACACDACAILFSGQGNAKFRRVPRHIRYLPDFRMTDSQWDGLMMPISMAFFFRSTTENRVIALYPSPAGATESLLSFETWDEIESENPALREMEPDVEALLVNRIGRCEYFIVPIDECFRLVGLIRSSWQGLSGGAEVWQNIGKFFSELKPHA